jgi:ribA/ribD-fused uncharacterized protein
MNDAPTDSQHLEHLIARFNAGERLKFLCFWGHQSNATAVTATCFSQWYASPFVVDGQSYLTAEHFMMAEKARLFHDQDVWAKIVQAPNPGAAKALGRPVKGFSEEVWSKHRFAIVVRGSCAKFSENQALRLVRLTLYGESALRVMTKGSITQIFGMGSIS